MSATAPSSEPPNPLLDTPNQEQQRLLEVIWQPYASDGRWPFYQYVDITLEGERPRIDAHRALLSCPSLLFQPGPGYGWVWLEGDRRFPKTGDRIGLTVAGLSRLPLAQLDVALFTRALQGLVSAARDFSPSPHKVKNIEVTSDELRGSFLPYARSAELRRLAEMLRHEPSTWAYVSQTADTGAWTATLDSRIRVYLGVTDVVDYLNRLVAEVAPPRKERPPTLTSSLALPEALDYLNVVWLVWTKSPLIASSRFEIGAKLGLKCSSSSDFDSAVSAICETLDQLNPVGAAKGPALKRVSKYLREHQLSQDAEPRVRAAFDDLEAIYDLRVWQQHGVERKGDRAMQRLGLNLPTADWGEAWDTLRARTVAAINVIREAADALRSHSQTT